MSRYAAPKAAIALGFLLGAMALLLLRRGREQPVPVVAAPQVVAREVPAAPKPPENGDQSGRIAELEKQLAAEKRTVDSAVATIKKLDEQVHAAGEPARHPPVKFPLNPPAPYQPVNARAVAEEAAKHCGMALELLEMNCDEYPCIALTKATDPKVKSFDMGQCAAWSDAYQQGTMTFATGYTQGGERVFAWLPLPPDQDLVRAVVARGRERTVAMAAGRYDFPSPPGQEPAPTESPKVSTSPVAPAHP